MTITSELSGNGIQKSFYGKARIHTYTDDTRIELYSYNTLVCTYKDGNIYRHWMGRSNTTTKHIKAFLIECRINPSYYVSTYKNLEYTSPYDI